MTANLVSTVIPVFNRSDMLKQAVQSVLNQTYRPIEIIIVDDGSTDETKQVVAELECRFDEVRLFRIKENAGVGNARELGRQEAKGAFIQYLDSDDLLLSNKFDVQIAALRNHPECGIAYGYTRLINEAGEVLKAPYKWTGKKLDRLFPTLLVDRWWNTHTPLFRRTVSDAVGPWLDMRISEDWEYEGRVAALGIKLIHCPEYLSDTRTHSHGRLTGSGAPEIYGKNLARLIPSLYASSIKAGVGHETAEMKHFSRWAFLIARQVGAFGYVREAKKCFKCAWESAGDHPDQKLKLYGFISKLIGWKLSGKVSVVLDRLVPRKPGESTQALSWKDD